jgi:hypothetical protein
MTDQLRGIPGAAAPARQKTPRHIEAEGKATEAVSRVRFMGAIIVGLLALAAIAIVCSPEHVKDILLVIGTGLGYFASRGDRSGGE